MVESNTDQRGRGKIASDGAPRTMKEAEDVPRTSLNVGILVDWSAMIVRMRRSGV